MCFNLNISVELLDLIQDGNLGLIKAVERMATEITAETENKSFEFQYDNGYFFKDIKNDRVLVWHKCVDKAKYYSVEVFEKMQKENICFNCQNIISDWELIDGDIENVEISFSTVHTVKINTDDLYIRVTVWLSSHNLSKEKSIFKKSNYCQRFTI